MGKVTTGQISHKKSNIYFWIAWFFVHLFVILILWPVMRSSVNNTAQSCFNSGSYLCGVDTVLAQVYLTILVILEIFCFLAKNKNKHLIAHVILCLIFTTTMWMFALGFGPNLLKYII